MKEVGITSARYKLAWVLPSDNKEYYANTGLYIKRWWVLHQLKSWNILNITN